MPARRWPRCCPGAARASPRRRSASTMSSPPGSPRRAASVVGTMSEQGGYGFGAGRISNPWSLSRVAERAAPVERRPLALLLLPCPLEDFALRAHAEDLLTGPGVVGIDP